MDKETTFEIKIRQARLYDIPAVSRIERDSFDDPWSVEEITNDIRCEDGSIYVAVAEIGDEKAGYADMRIAADEAQIYNIAIAPEFRGNGIGEALLMHMIERSEELGCNLMTLEVRESNEAARRLYGKLGFGEVGRRKGYYRKGKEDAVLMNKMLGRAKFDMQID